MTGVLHERHVTLAESCENPVVRLAWVIYVSRKRQLSKSKARGTTVLATLQRKLVVFVALLMMHNTKCSLQYLHDVTSHLLVIIWLTKYSTGVNMTI
jgi:hypothetical protein